MLEVVWDTKYIYKSPNFVTLFDQLFLWPISERQRLNHMLNKQWIEKLTFTGPKAKHSSDSVTALFH